MPVHAEPTPNPNAIKFTVGRPVGGPKTFTAAGAAADDPVAAGLLAIDGVVSVFLTADFITVTKDPSADWGTITPQATSMIDSHYA